MVVLAAIALGAISCGGEGPRHRVPELRGERLDLAEERLDVRGLEWEELGGGALGILVRSNWYVCGQEPDAGTRAHTVRLIVDRDCPEPRVPLVLDKRLDRAVAKLDELGIGYRAETRVGNTPVVLRRWHVCEQEPYPGSYSYFVELGVARDCD
jgi:hypothetical protein